MGGRAWQPKGGFAGAPALPGIPLWEGSAVVSPVPASREGNEPQKGHTMGPAWHDKGHHSHSLWSELSSKREGAVKRILLLLPTHLQPGVQNLLWGKVFLSWHPWAACVGPHWWTSKRPLLRREIPACSPGHHSPSSCPLPSAALTWAWSLTDPSGRFVVMWP